jgi:hypothetical protein
MGTSPGRDIQPSDHCHMHVRQFVKRILIHAIVLTITQEQKVRISHYVPVAVLIVGLALHISSAHDRHRISVETER